MGRLVKNSEIEISLLNATQVTSGGSPVLTVANSTFDNVIYVAKNGNDANDGRSMATPKLTIAGAMAIATSGTAVKVASGSYTEVMPITVPANVAIVGDDVRSVFIQPATTSSDMFYMNNGTYVWGVTVRNYTGKAFSFPPTGAGVVTVSPYIQNVTSFTTTGTTVYIDGSLNTGEFSTRAMILGFITSINRGGYGLVMVNRAYSQAVNVYTIACEVGIKVESGSFLTLNGSDCGIGNIGLWSDGISSQFTGTVLGNIQIGGTSCNICNITRSFSNLNIS